jgi:hypothetical protein
MQANINMKMTKELMIEFVSFMNMVRSSKNMNIENFFQFSSGGTVKEEQILHGVILSCCELWYRCVTSTWKSMDEHWELISHLLGSPIMLLLYTFSPAD